VALVHVVLVTEAQDMCLHAIMLVEGEELSWLKEAKSLSPPDLGWSTQAAMELR
jgi:hypothetical protein